MPHQIIEYSANLGALIDIDELVAVMHDAAAAIEVLPVGGLRTRAVAREHYRVADGHKDNAFINVVLRIAPSRTFEEKKAAGETLFQALGAFLEPIYESSPLAISFEIQEIDADLRWKQNNIRDYMDKRNEGSRH